MSTVAGAKAGGAKPRDPGAAFHEVTESVCAVHERPKPPTAWYVALAISSGMLGMFLVSVVWLLMNGIGIYGNNNTTGWAFPIVNFVFWIGIGHAGTLISAILYLLLQTRTRRSGSSPGRSGARRGSASRC